MHRNKHDKKQPTLFQSWSKANDKNQPSSQKNLFQTVGAKDKTETTVDYSDDDRLLQIALKQSLDEYEKSVNKTKSTTSSETPATVNDNIGIVDSRNAGTSKDTVVQEFDDDWDDEIDIIELDKSPSIEDVPGFDEESGRMWIYPINYPVRKYQYDIVEAALTRNTLVVLPTGLGKTFIAAVLMYNIYRWFPEGKVIFMAPTKPLVAQQIVACYDIMGIPKKCTAEMTGAMKQEIRQECWATKRVFFLTPQVLSNDIARGCVPTKSIKCLVIDEAHKAQGNFAYCLVVKELAKTTLDFRILALSATPGNKIKDVQEVVNNLLISHIELRTEDSPDIAQYSHVRLVVKEVVKLNEQLKQYHELYLQILDRVISRLRKDGVLYGKSTADYSVFILLTARTEFRSNPPKKLAARQAGSIEAEFALAISLYHGFELLLKHGLRSLLNYLESVLSGEKSSHSVKSALSVDEGFCRLLDDLRCDFRPIKYADPNALLLSQTGLTQGSSGLRISHPKIEKLLEIVVDHFKTFQPGGDGAETRVMIFATYRDTVSEITELLTLHRPLIKVMSFIGHSTGKTSRGFTQKDQLKVVQQFRDGGFNTLVSTCVGEEGLDIGEVDLIVCFDAHKSPIRLVQRMGRTGRKREGKVVMLVTEGKEEQVYNQSQYSKRSIHKAILNSAKSLRLFPPHPRPLPPGLQPVCQKVHIQIPREQEPVGKAKVRKGKAGRTDGPEDGAGTEKAKGKQGRKKKQGEGHDEEDDMRDGEAGKGDKLKRKRTKKGNESLTSKWH